MIMLMIKFVIIKESVKQMRLEFYDRKAILVSYFFDAYLQQKIIVDFITIFFK